jgi:hypothetical protein
MTLPVIAAPTAHCSWYDPITSKTHKNLPGNGVRQVSCVFSAGSKGFPKEYGIALVPSRFPLVLFCIRCTGERIFRDSFLLLPHGMGPAGLMGREFLFPL